MDSDLLYKILLEEVSKQNNNYSDLRGKVNKVNSYGEKISNVGDFLNNSKLSTIGNQIQNTTSNINGILDKPSQYASNIAGNGLSKAGNYFTNQLNAQGIGNALSNVGSNLASHAVNSGLAGLGTGAGATGATAGTIAGNAATSGSSAALAGGPVGAIIALASMALTGANRKRAKQSAAQSQQMADLGLQEADNQTEQAIQNVSNLVPQNVTTTTDTTPVVDNILTQYQDYLRQNGYDENTINGVAQGLNGGNKDIAEWQQQYAKSKNGQNANFKIPTTEEEIELAKSGKFNVVNPTQVGGVSITGKKSLLNSIANGLSDMSKGYQENRNNAFSPENLRSDDSKNKMTRLGEAFGSIARIAQSPLAQGTIAGLVTGLATGNPLAGISNAYKFANQRQMSDLYNQVLKEQGINVPVGTFGNIKANDVDTVLTPKYKDVVNNIALAKLAEQEEYHKDMTDIKREQNENIKAYRAADLKIKQQKANAKTNNGGGKSSSSKPQQHKDWNKNLSEFTSIYNSGDVDKTDYARAKFIEIHGVDPLKYIK